MGSGHEAEGGDRDGDGRQAGQDRQRACHHPTEDQEQEHDGERGGIGLAALKVCLGIVDEGVVDGARAAEVHPRRALLVDARGVARELDEVVRRLARNHEQRHGAAVCPDVGLLHLRSTSGRLLEVMLPGRDLGPVSGVVGTGGIALEDRVEDRPRALREMRAQNVGRLLGFGVGVEAGG